MKRLKWLWFLFIQSLVLAVIFGIGLIVPEMKDNVLGRVGLWCGLISQLMLAAVMFSELRREKNGGD